MSGLGLPDWHQTVHVVVWHQPGASTLKDNDTPRPPFDPAKLKPAQIRQVQRAVRHIIFGMLLKVAPLFTLLLAGLILGLLPAIPIYLAIRLACLGALWKRREPIPSRQRAIIEILVFLLGSLSLATLSPIWFQLEITLILALVLAIWIVSGRSPLPDIDFFPKASLIGEKPAGLMKTFYIVSLMAAPLVNLWLAVQFSETIWLLFRTLGLLLWLGGSVILTMWLAQRNAKPEAS